MKEKTLAVFKYGENKYNLLEITHKQVINDIINQYDMPATTGKHKVIYLIVKNRRRIAQTIWEETAKKRFMSIIAAELLQQKITF